MNHPSNHDKLERLIADTLRTQPPRRAPDTLQLRVLDEIKHRAMPWWRMNFSRWPLAARGVFLVVCAAAAKLAIDLSAWLMDGLDSTPVVSGVASATLWIRLLAGIVTSLVNTIPSLWIYGGIAAVAAMYVALFGIGAAAYRTLWQPSRQATP